MISWCGYLSVSVILVSLVIVEWCQMFDEEAQAILWVSRSPSRVRSYADGHFEDLAGRPCVR